MQTFIYKCIILGAQMPAIALRSAPLNWKWTDLSEMLGADTFKNKEINKKNKLLEGQRMQIQDLLILFQAFTSDLMNNHRQATSCCFSIH